MMRFNVDFKQSDQKIPLCFDSTRNRIEAAVENFQRVEIIGDVEYYTGAYTVTPKTTGQYLATRDKMMSDDVTIKEIPYYETSNVSGGNTVYIGKEIEINGN